ncbi:hypothetical protein [Sinorhizobium meliloti]|uniref:hypothetical protein n=1 Tax=Rhizobium meliloti TaxID=382 RepID=UPI000FDB1D27|nr:hypothetical protein [Sinorhizobium meliloti]RVQ10047.1 hypothetical protein CN067_34100 [Sinorhizobium meliloti]RVQ55762.1 hypothetical protein CN060_21175 [Sinorhizobium meliloti]
MINRPAKYHAIERTSPKGQGQKYVGTCWQCGKTNLTLSDATEVCENIAGLTEDESLIFAVDGPEEPSA